MKGFKYALNLTGVVVGVLVVDWAITKTVNAVLK